MELYYMLFYTREVLKNMEKYKRYLVPLFFLVLSIIGIIGAGVSMNFVLSELYARFVRNGIFVIALLIPIMAGMGINFAIKVGALAAHTALIIIADNQIYGLKGFLLAILISTVLSVILGNIIGYILNKAKGKEMITSIVIGFLATNLYQLLFMVGYGTIIKAKNSEIMLSRGIGLRNNIDLAEFKKLFDGILTIRVGDTNESLAPVIIIVVVALLVYYISGSRIGHHIKAVGGNINTSQAVGIDTNRVRRIAIVISTVLASLGQIMYIQNIGMLNIYTDHLNIDIFSAAALLVGGATLKNANIRNAFIGVLLFHTLFIVSPLAGQNLFKHAALGEYFRSFLAYGTIVFAFIMNLRYESESKL
ncbi:ABC transporter permease [Tissierella creatinini]|nr:ABC transporter permease [Tissierella creatinini]TJX64578.1 ABC transporter permease [Soehngenia saccharolytica]